MEQYHIMLYIQILLLYRYRGTYYLFPALAVPSRFFSEAARGEPSYLLACMRDHASQSECNMEVLPVV